jgi:hypothetical protein
MLLIKATVKFHILFILAIDALRIKKDKLYDKPIVEEKRDQLNGKKL